MNILLLAEVSAMSVIGGAERVLREQAFGLRRRGHDVSVMARAPVGDPRPHVEIGSILEHRYMVSRRNEVAFVLTSAVRSVRLFDAWSKQRKPDAVLVHQSLAGLGPILHRRAQAGRWVYVCHSLAHEEYLSRTPATATPLQRARRGLNARVRLWSERAVMRRCSRIVVLSEFMKRRVLAAHRELESRIRLVRGAADSARFWPSRDRVEVRRRLALPLNKVLLLCVRNLVPRMGLENLLLALAELDEALHDVLVLVGGEGPLRPVLQQAIQDLQLSDRVRLIGFIAEEDLPSYYQAADLVLMPTRELEGFGLVTVEALACGTPVLGTPVGALPEVLARVDPGLVADGADSTALSKAIRRLLDRFRDRPGDRERLSHCGRKLVEEEFTWDRHCERLEAVLYEAIKEA